MLFLLLGRWIHIYSSSLLFSLIAFDRLYVIPALSRDDGSCPAAKKQKRLIWICWLAMFGSGILWLLSVVVSMTGSEIEFTAVQQVVAVTQFGHLWLFRSILWLGLGGMLLFDALSNRSLVYSNFFCIGLATVNVVSLALAGHTAASVGGLAVLHLMIDASHLLVSAVWPSGLLPLAVWLFVTRKAQEYEVLPSINKVLERFSAISLVAVAILAATGVANSVLMLKRANDLYTTIYGQILVLKILAFVVMIAVGARNRYLLKARQESESCTDKEAKWLFRNICIESALAFIVFGLVGLLGAVAPPG
jgi:copper resistance protein D